MTASTKPLFRAISGKGRKVISGAALPLLPDAEIQPRPRSDKRRSHDFYPTGQPEAIRALLAYDGDRIRAAGSVWEPACGDGALVREIRAAGFPCSASDLVDRGCPDSWQADFFSCLRPRGRAIITNPPYNLINAKDGHGAWLKHTMEMPDWTYCAFLLSWDWPAARKNGLGLLLQRFPFSYTYLMRWKLDFTGEGSPPQRNAWFVWVRGWEGTPMQIRFMDREDGRQGNLMMEEDDERD